MQQFDWVGVAFTPRPHIYCAQVASRVGLRMSGVNLPAHFMLRPEGMEWLVDAFNGGELTALEDAEALLGKLTGYQVRACARARCMQQVHSSTHRGAPHTQAHTHTQHTGAAGPQVSITVSSHQQPRAAAAAVQQPAPDLHDAQRGRRSTGHHRVR